MSLKYDFSIPRCMSTQHPDNVSSPFFAHKSVLAGDDEITEAYYVFSHLMCDEQMWDCEGKEADLYVIKKLLTRYKDFFLKEKLGKNKFITLRVPNPRVEKAEAKLLCEALETIPRSFDIAKIFYKEHLSPIFEVIMPMASSVQDIDRVYHYYSNFVYGRQDKMCYENDILVSEWIGEYLPRTINVIPLFEDKEGMLNAHNILRAYLSKKDIPYQRVFFARSDPAMNYGMISALLLNKIALQNVDELSKELQIPIYPILGVGSAPMRGRLTPPNVDNVLKEYPSVHTYTAQSAFKFDYPPDQVIQGIQKILHSETSSPCRIDKERALDIIGRMETAFQHQVCQLAPIINKVANHVPRRRLRKQHIGLFGYSRNVGGVGLPRAITFTASLYSLGLPPELLGINILSKEDMSFLRDVYINFDRDFERVLSFYNPDCPHVPQEISSFIKNMGIAYETNKEHSVLSSQLNQLLKDDFKASSSEISELILELGQIRQFLG